MQRKTKNQTVESQIKRATGYKRLPSALDYRPNEPTPRTVLHKDGPAFSAKGVASDYTCVDCGVNTAPGIPPPAMVERMMNGDGKPLETCITPDSEMYMVKNKIWEAARMEPWGGCLCIGCLEKRIGRRLRPKDFKRGHPFNQPNIPATKRLRERRGDFERDDCVIVGYEEDSAAEKDC